LNKRFLIIGVLSALWFAYVVFCVLNFSGVDAVLGCAYYAITVAVLIYICIIVFRVMIKTEGSGAVLTGTLALCSYAVYEVYSFAYIFIYQGGVTDITIGYYSRSCAALFLATTSMAIIKSPKIRRNRFNIAYNLILTAVIIFTLLAVITVDIQLLLSSLLTILFLCVLPAAYILIRSVKVNRFKAYRLFASMVIAISMLDAAGRVIKFYDLQPIFLDIIFTLYLPVYILLGLTIFRLGQPNSKE